MIPYLNIKKKLTQFIFISDSDESVHREVNIMIPKFCFDYLNQIEEPMFRNGQVKFNKEQFVHLIDS